MKRQRRDWRCDWRWEKWLEDQSLEVASTHVQQQSGRDKKTPGSLSELEMGLRGLAVDMPR